jgi:hypothetical protein
LASSLQSHRRLFLLTFVPAATGHRRSSAEAGHREATVSDRGRAPIHARRLSLKLEEIEDAATRQVFLDAVAHGSVISWQHINLLGEYDFSD